MKKIKVECAVGAVLAHDLTKITRGQFKGVAFIKGHIVTREDIPELLKIGKQSIYVLELDHDQLHEDDAAKRIASAISHPDLKLSEPKEGKINICAQKSGLLKIDVDRLLQINRMDSIIVATLKNNFPCEKGQIIAATRIIPLTIETRRIEILEKLARQRGSILSVKTYRTLCVGAVVTGSEIYKGLITDDFDSSIGKKIIDAGGILKKKITVPDDDTKICEAVQELKDLGCNLIITTGGLSVDPDDVTRQGVLKSGAKEIFYGSPILPGAMLMVSKLGNIDILSLLACVFYYQRTVFDLIFPRILAGEKIRKDDMAAMGHGGLCMDCKTCHYPVCSFGR